MKPLTNLGYFDSFIEFKAREKMNKYMETIKSASTKNTKDGKAYKDFLDIFGRE